MHLHKRSYTGDWLIFRPCVPSHAARPNRPKNVPVPFAAPEENVTRSVTSTACRRGFSLLELGVAMAVLGLALVGMFPLVIMYSRGLTKLEQSSPMQNVQGSSATWYLIPSSDAWARKLGAAAQLTSDATKLGNYASPLTIPPSTAIRNDSPTTDSDGDGIMDYSDPGWSCGSTPSAYNQDYHYTNALPSWSRHGGFAVWSFQISTAGWYAIQTTWPSPTGLHLTTVQYQITLAGTPITGSPFNIDQTNTSAGIPDETGLSLVWCKLTPGLVYLTPGLLQVQLSNVQPNSNANSRSVIADAVRLVQNDVQMVSLDRSLNSQNLTVHVSITPRICQ